MATYIPDWVCIWLTQPSAQINTGLIFLNVPEKLDVSVRLSVHVFPWARKHRHKYSCCFCCAAREYLGVWLPVQNSSCLLQIGELLASVKRKLQLPRDKTLLSFLPHRKENCPVHTGLTTRAENENRLEKQQDACHRVFGVSENKIHLSSPDETLVACRWFGGGRPPFAETGKLARFPELCFLEHDGELWERVRNCGHKRHDFYRLFASRRSVRMLGRSL